MKPEKLLLGWLAVFGVGAGKDVSVSMERTPPDPNAPPPVLPRILFLSASDANPPLVAKPANPPLLPGAVDANTLLCGPLLLPRAANPVCPNDGLADSLELPVAGQEESSFSKAAGTRHERGCQGLEHGGRGDDDSRARSCRHECTIKGDDWRRRVLGERTVGIVC